MPLGQRRAYGIKFVNEGAKTDKKPCVVKGYYRAKDSWDLLCKRYPFKAGAKIKVSELRALEDIGIYCPGWKLPTVDKVNMMCDYYCKE